MNNQKINNQFNEHINLAYWIANKYVSNYQKEKEDLYQEALIGLWKATCSFNKNKKVKFTTYAGVVINNEILLYLRKLKKVALDISIYTQIDENLCILDTIEDYATEMDEHLELEIIKQAIENLPDRKARVLKLWLSGYKQQEIAEKMKLSQSRIARLKNDEIKKIQKSFL